MPHHRRNIAIFVGLFFVLAACSSQAETQPPPENTPTPANTSLPEATDLPEPTNEPTEEPPTVPQTMFSSDRAQQISDAGVIRVGVRPNSLSPFIEVEGGHTGFEVELVEAMVEWLFAGSVEIEWVGVSTGERFSGLDEGQFDLLARTVIHTQSRDGVALWSNPYFIGGLRLLVREEEGISSFAELDGKRVSVLEGTNVQEIVRTVAISSGIEIVEVISDTNDAAIAAFANGDADAFVSDWIFLLSLSSDEPSFQIVGDFLTRQPFAMGIPLGEETFQEDVNQALRAIVENGTYDSIYDRWFTEPHPWTLDEMLQEPPA